MIRFAIPFVLAVALGPAAAHAEPAVTILPLGFEAEEIRGPATRVAATAASLEAFRDVRNAMKTPMAIVWGREGAAAVTLEGGQLRVHAAKRGAGDLRALERGRDTLPASRVGGSGALTAQFEMPTRNYAHDALGSPQHAGVLAISERKPSPPTNEPKPVAQDVVRIPAGEDAVFEDREPHLVRLGGEDAILAVRSYRERGSALLVVAKRDGVWRATAETPPDGEPYRWLNPAMAGLNQARDIAVVRRPHLDGLLQLWRLDGDKLVLRAEKPGYSNHVYGSAAQDLAAWIGTDGAASRLVVPTLDRTALAVLKVEPELMEIARIPLPAKVANGVVALGRGNDARVLVGLEDGRIADVRP